VCKLHGAVLERVVIRGGKIDYLNLRKAKLRDVVFESCVLVEPDFLDARLERVEFVDCALKGAGLHGGDVHGRGSARGGGAGDRAGGGAAVRGGDQHGATAGSGTGVGGTDGDSGGGVRGL